MLDVHLCPFGVFLEVFFIFFNWDVRYLSYLLVTQSKAEIAINPNGVPALKDIWSIGCILMELYTGPL
jgi:hypothetical protein